MISNLFLLEIVGSINRRQSSKATTADGVGFEGLGDRNVNGKDRVVQLGDGEYVFGGERRRRLGDIRARSNATGRLAERAQQAEHQAAWLEEAVRGRVLEEDHLLQQRERQDQRRPCAHPRLEQSIPRAVRHPG